jgi:hypothetical protein
VKLPDWRREIESLTGGRIVTVPVITDKAENVLRIPPEFPGRSVVRNLLVQESFVSQLVRAHALNVNYQGSEGTFHFILLNTALAEEWKDNEEGLLGHEYGHIWLNGLGYGSPSVGWNGVAPCVLTHAGDVVQHVLIRDETRRRGFNYLSFWFRNIERWMEASTSGLAADPCVRVQLVSMYLDTVLGADAGEWPHMEQFRRRVTGASPRGIAKAAELEQVLRALDLWDRSHYEYALQRAIETLVLVHEMETR